MRQLIKSFLISVNLFLMALFMLSSACYSMENDSDTEFREKKARTPQKKALEIEIETDVLNEKEDKIKITEEKKGKKFQKNETEVVVRINSLEGQDEKGLLNSSSPLLPQFQNRNVDAVANMIKAQMMHFGISTLSTVRTYILDSNDDSFNTFAQNMDTAFFQSSSKKVKIAKMLGSLYGVGVPIAMSGLILGAIGGSINPDLHPPIEYTIILTTFPVAAHVGYQRAGQIATSLFRERKYTTKSNDEEEDEEDLKPHITSKNLVHKVAIVMGTVGAGLNALIPTVLMISEEVPYFNTFAAVSSPFIWVFYTDAYYTMMRHYLRDFFNAYSYSPPHLVKLHALSTGIDQFLELINHPNKTVKEESDALVNLVYDTFFNALERYSLRKKANQKRGEKKNDVLEEALEEKEIMLFSLLMVTDLTREEENPNFSRYIDEMLEEDDEEEGKREHGPGLNLYETSKAQEEDLIFPHNNDEIWQEDNGEKGKGRQETELEQLGASLSSEEPQSSVKNLKNTIQRLNKEIKDLEETAERGEAFKKDLEATRPLWKEAFMETLSQLMVGAAYYGRVEILQTTVEQILIATGVDPVTSANIAYAVAISEVSFRTLVETKVHKEEFKGWLSAFSFRKLKNLTFLRKAANLSAAVDGIIFSLPSILVGLTAFEDYSPLAKVALIGPCAILDFNIFTKLFSRHNNAIITGAATVRKSKSQCMLGKRAHLNRWAQEAKETLPKFTERTTSILYEKLMKGIREKKLK